MTTLTDHDDTIESLPPSAKLALWVLESEGKLTQQELRKETRLHQRTLRYALDRLDEEGLIDSRPNPADARQSLYSITK
ncbi:helix-turn-helix domain-containing protein [Natrinema pallidum]|uniref:MarR family transcriptional regulator n=1 Tax=Natrinema pallidum TaxID=69527 RepID=A0A4V1IF29_9EURY|nr:helix-turn-helix domain-containing protein [Natrinema pallidum]QCW03554.1 MarR family transcriptional regulator [Natrinema pallidum]